MPLIGEILTGNFKVDASKIELALRIQMERGGLLGEILLSQKIIDETTLAAALAMRFGMPFMKELPSNIDGDLVANLPMNYANAHLIIPFKLEDNLIRVAMADPLQVSCLDDIRTLFNVMVIPYMAPKSQVQAMINLVYSAAKNVTDQLGDDALDEYQQESDEFADITDLVADDASDEPIIKFVNNLLFRAVKEHSSDIHIEPMEREVVVRYRVDGVLYEVTRIPKAAQSRIISRVKIMGNLNIAEKRVPQDGRIRIKIAGKDVDIRLSTLPTSHGERIVMRLLDRSTVLLDVTDLGFDQRKLQDFNTLIHQPHGIMLVTGPTGSGKTTTLYAALSKLNSPDRNIITIEDPVEYQLPGIGQIHVNSKINMTFAAGLRSILRQDPDVIMVGEIRDFETAEIAVQASLTGHLVLSTIHTNDASSSITRMVDMGVEPFLVGSSVIGIMAQRLVRRLCSHCKEPYHPTDAEISELGARIELVIGTERPEAFYRAAGCMHCNERGYSGRSAIFELLMVNDAIRQMILTNSNSTVLKRKAMENGMFTLREDGVRNIYKGVTSVDEVIRVTQDEAIAEW